jgi:hypothetical protein
LRAGEVIEPALTAFYAVLGQEQNKRFTGMRLARSAIRLESSNAATSYCSRKARRA